MISKVFAAGLLVAEAISTPVARSSHRHGSCQQLDIPITVSAPSAIYNVTHVDDDITAMVWTIDVDTWSAPQRGDTIIKNTTTSGTYNIHAQLCFPHSPANDQPNLLQIATHGVFYDSRYWDSKLDPEKYSYVEAALKAGYSILTYDRLGVGESDHPDAYTVVQAPLELEILKELTLMARNNTLGDLTNTAYGAPDKIIHVGHSFGSFLTSAFIGTYPSLSDGAIITGYVLNKHFGDIGYTSWGLQYAATADPPYDRPSGYAVPSKQGIQAVFYGGQPGVAFTKELLDYGNAIKQPVPVGELTSSYQFVGVPGPAFEGPIQFMMPEFDFFICGGDCKNTYSLAQLHELYPKASAIEVYIQPNTGHALPLHNNATAGFQASFDFLEKHGLGTSAAKTG